MLLIPPDTIKVDQSLFNDIDNKLKSIYRAITFCKNIFKSIIR